jgi:(p)ppGpp synthase/HD superfamily hydrolase
MTGNSCRGLFEAVSFAARAHRHQVRKDGQTPYCAHAFRVCLTIRHIFEIDDLTTLTAALLHDTLEDTPTDYDEICDAFGDDVADCVAALTKDMRLPEARREAVYVEQLLAGNWRVTICKLADCYDNLVDSRHLSRPARLRQIQRVSCYLEALRSRLPEKAGNAFAIVEAMLEEARAWE